MVAQFLPAILGGAKALGGAAGGALASGGKKALAGIGNAAVNDLVNNLLGGQQGGPAQINAPQVQSELPSIEQLQSQLGAAPRLGRRFG